MNVVDSRRAADDQASKFVYGLWRPVTAIRQADTDLNPATEPDPTWLPLIPTPPYPSYAGNMADDRRQRRARAGSWRSAPTTCR